VLGARRSELLGPEVNLLAHLLYYGLTIFKGECCAPLPLECFYLDLFRGYGTHAPIETITTQFVFIDHVDVVTPTRRPATSE
jgi:hypothetical protein